MTYGSVCSGIEATSVAWEPLGWKPAWFAEIDRFPSAVLVRRWPQVENRGDITRFKEWPDETIDLLVGGTPCQSFSLAGLRKGMDDPRGNLALVFLAIARRTRARWVVFENVPGVRSVSEGKAFGSILGGMAELGYGVAYRSLDAQYDGLAQRRQRVFVVGYLGDWRRAAAVLFDRESLSGNPAPRRAMGEDITTLPSRTRSGGGEGSDTETPVIVGTLNTNNGWEAGRLIASWDPRNVTSKANRAKVEAGRAANTLHEHGGAIIGLGVRRLTPRECERLQGFPDDYTLIPYRRKMAADRPRYKAIGNSMAVPTMRWIGERIQAVEDCIMPPTQGGER